MVVIKNDLSFGGKRELPARRLLWSVAFQLLSLLSARDYLPVLNDHRVGNPEGDLFESEVFFGHHRGFNRQIGYLKRQHSLMTFDEALTLVDGSIKEKTSRCRA